MLTDIVKRGLLTARGVVGFWKANSKVVVIIIIISQILQLTWKSSIFIINSVIIIVGFWEVNSKVVVIIIVLTVIFSIVIIIIMTCNTMKLS